MEILAHRGDTTQGHENTLEAFQSAFDKGADGFEFDIRLTRDGIAVVYHDLMIGEVFISDLDYADLKTMHFPRGSNKFHIPSLEDVLESFAGKIYLEIHLQSDTYQTASTVCRMIEQYPQINDMYELTTFEPAMINIINTIKPAHPCDLLFRIESWMTDEMALRLLFDKASLTNARGVHLFPHQIKADVLSRFTARGLTVHCGVTNDIAEFQRIESLGVSQILTDDISLYISSAE